MSNPKAPLAVAFSIDRIAPVFSGFEAYYAAHIQPKLAALEPRRRKLVRDCAVIVATALLAAISIGYAVLTLFHSAVGVFAVLFVALMIAVLGLNWRMEDDYAAANDALVGGIARFLKLEHRSDLKRPRSLETAKKYGLVPRYDAVECGDVIEGEWANAAFSVSEVFLSRRRKSRKSDKTVFAGQLMRITRRVGVNPPVILVKRRGLFAGRHPPFEDACRVHGLPAKLDRRFRVWSAAPDSGRQTAALLAPLAEKLQVAYGSHALAIGFSGNKVYIAIGNGHRLTPGSMLTPFTGRKRLRRAVVAFKQILDTVEWAAA